MNDGLSAAIAATISFVPSSGRSFFGGKTSNETDGPPFASISDIFMRVLYHFLTNACRAGNQIRQRRATPARIAASAKALRRRFVSRNTAPPRKKVRTTLERRIMLSTDILAPSEPTALK